MVQRVVSGESPQPCPLRRKRREEEGDMHRPGKARRNGNPTAAPSRRIVPPTRGWSICFNRPAGAGHGVAAWPDGTTRTRERVRTG